MYFILWTWEELEPVFCLVEDLREEYKSGTIRSGRLDMNTPQFNIIALNKSWSCMYIMILPLRWVIVENRRAAIVVNFLIWWLLLNINKRFVKLIKMGNLVFILSEFFLHFQRNISNYRVGVRDGTTSFVFSHFLLILVVH